MEFIDRLMELRRKRGWSQEDLADKVNVSRQTISKWENGESVPEMNNLIRLSEVFEITLDELIKGESPSKSVDTNSINIPSNNYNDNNNTINYIRNSKDSNEAENANKNKFNKLKKIIFKKKNIIRIIAALICLLIGAYLIVCAYRFSILKDINNKFNAVKNENNYYYERSEMYVDGNNMHLISRTKYWYKDGILKKIIEKYDEEENKYNVYSDFNKNEQYVFDEKNKIGKKYTINIKKNIIKNISEDYYYNSTFKIIKDSLDIKNIKINKSKELYIIEDKNNLYNKIEYNKSNGILQKIYILNENNEENTITYKLEFGDVTDEELKMIDTSNYIME